MSIQITDAANRSNERTKSAGKCGQIYGGPTFNFGPWEAISMAPITD
jgi:hypothetical protein